MATHTIGKATIEELQRDLKRIEDEEIRFALEVVVDEKAKELRAIVLKRLEEVITLDDILEAFINKKKQRDISIWATRDR